MHVPAHVRVFSSSKMMSTKTTEANETVLIKPLSDGSHPIVYSHRYIAQFYVYSQLMAVLIEIL